MSVLCLDFRQTRYRLFLVSDTKILRRSALPVKGGFPLLAGAIVAWGLRRQPPTAVAVIKLSGVGHLTWSSMRGVAAMANTLALAWNTPLFSVAADGDEPDKAVLERVRAQVSDARPCVWFRPEYGGEPHITTPKARS